MSVKTKPKAKVEKTFTPTTLRPAAAPTSGQSFFRDPAKAPAKPQAREGEVEHIIYSDEKLQEFCQNLDERERETAAILIEYQMVNDGQPKTSRRGGSIWQDARRKVVSGFIQFGVDLSEVRGDMEGGGMELSKTDTTGVVL